MMPEGYKKALLAAEKELVGEQKRLRRAYGRIGKLKETISALKSLCDRPAAKSHFVRMRLSNFLQELWMTEMCRHTLKISEGSLSPPGVIHELKQWERMGSELRLYANPLVSICRILRRLVDSGEAQRVAAKRGAVTYKWVAFSSVPGRRAQKKLLDALIRLSVGELRKGGDGLAGQFKIKRKPESKGSQTNSPTSKKRRP